MALHRSGGAAAATTSRTGWAPHERKWIRVAVGSSIIIGVILIPIRATRCRALSRRRRGSRSVVLFGRHSNHLLPHKSNPIHSYKALIN